MQKKSLSTGINHVYAIRQDGTVTLIKKSSGKNIISHAVAAANQPIVCAGEVRLRSLCVNGKWLKVIDLSNESGHYRPTAIGLPKAIKAFENLGYIVHRVNTVHTQLPETLNKVEDNNFSFKSLSRSSEV